jgi:hypothetical protein
MRREHMAVAVSTAGRGVVAHGSTLDVRVVCEAGVLHTGRSGFPTSGVVEVGVLADPNDDEVYLAVGVDFAKGELYADHAHIGNATIRQIAPLTHENLGSSFELRVLVDNAMIETFAAGVALSSFVSPTGTAMPTDRVVHFRQADIAGCTLDVWNATLPNTD